MARIHQRHFRRYSKRGPISSVLMETDAGDRDMATVFWNEIGQDPKNEDEAAALLASMQARIIRTALDASSDAVAKGVLRNPNEMADWQREIVRRRARKAGWDA